MVTEFSPLGGVVTAVATRLGLDFASTCCDCPRVEEGRSWLCPPGIGMQATTTSPPCLQAPCIGETHFIRRQQTEFHMLVFPIQSHRRALAVTKNTGIGRCHRSAAGHRRRHTHPDTDRTTSKTYSSSKVLWVKGAPATSSCTGGDTHLPRCELPHDC